MTARHVPRFVAAAMVLMPMITAARALAAEPSLRALDFFPTAVSVDGGVVVGGSDSRGAMRWTAGGGTVAIGALPGHAGSRAYDLSADGSVVVGSSWQSPAHSAQAFRWTAGGGMAGLGPYGSDAYAVSADGSTVVGSNNYQATRWTASGMTTILFRGRANDVSADGSVVVGQRSGEVIGTGQEVTGTGDVGGESIPPYAFRWTADGGSVLLDFTDAKAVSANGSVIAGSNGAHAFRWTSDGGVIGLGTLPGRDFSLASGISADGSVIVGTAIRFPDSDSAAFVWDQVQGMRSLRDTLIDLDVEVTGWHLSRATAVSADGLTIVGIGTAPSGQSVGWVATIPEPGFIAPALLVLGATLARRRLSPKGA